MAEEEALEPVFVFFFAWFGLTLAVFPLVATLDSAAFGGSLGSLIGLGVSVVVSIPAALEFLFSDRNPRLVGKFVAVFVGLFFLVILGQSAVYVALGIPETIPVVDVGVLLVTYVVTYVLVYRGWLARLRAGLSG